jgi:hypothetical protein
VLIMENFVLMQVSACEEIMFKGREEGVLARALEYS